MPRGTHARVILRYARAGEAVLYAACYVTACTVQPCLGGHGCVVLPRLPLLRHPPLIAASRPRGALCCNMLRFVATCCAVLQDIVLCCNVVYCACNMLRCVATGVFCVARHCAVLRNACHALRGRYFVRCCRSWLQADLAMGGTGLAIKAAGRYLYKLQHKALAMRCV